MGVTVLKGRQKGVPRVVQAGREVPTFRASEVLYLQPDHRRGRNVSNIVSNRYIYELCSANPKKNATSGMTFIRDSRRTRIIRGPTHEAGAEL